MRDIAKMKGYAENFRRGAQQRALVQKSVPLAPSARPRRAARQLAAIIYSLIMLALIAAPAAVGQLKQLADKQKAELKKNFQTTIAKRKGPFGKNMCVCSDGRKEPVLRPDGSVQNVCGDKTEFCSAFRAPWAAALGQQDVYVGNLFTTDLFEWDRFDDHHDLVRGHVLEKYFIETHPDHKLATAKTLSGVSGSEYEQEALVGFVEKYLSLDGFNDYRHFLLAYELQKRFFMRAEQGGVDKVRNMATQIQGMDAKFGPLRNAVHNQISAALIPRLSAYRDGLPDGQTRKRIDELIAEIEKLTALDESALNPQLAEIKNPDLRSELESLMPAGEADPMIVITSLSDIMVLGRSSVAERSVSPDDARRLIDLIVTTGAVIQSRGNAYLESGKLQTVQQHLQFLAALTNASYGVGLLSKRERQAALANLQAALDKPRMGQIEFIQMLERVNRVVEWAHTGALLAFAEVWPEWTYVLPEVTLIGDDILRGSPLLIFGQTMTRIKDYAAGQQRKRHQIFGAEFTSQIRALNPGLARGKLRVNPKDGTYSREEILALAQTPAELQPAAGIVTQGEGNVVSHVQLLARALGIPNVVTGPEPFKKIADHDAKDAFFLVTPGGRVYLKEAAKMTDQDVAVYDEYNRNTGRTADGKLGAGAGKLDIDHEKLDISVKMPLTPTEVGIADSGVRCGPKAAYLGELKRLFPDNVSRGVVLPFGVYFAHFQQAKVALPVKLKNSNIAKAGEALEDFVKRTYQKLFKEMIPAGTSEKELSAWIKPRLEIFRTSIIEHPLAPDLRQAIQKALDDQGLLQSDDKSQTVGCFVRSDTNVEDLENFNGAGLNLTIFNLKSLEDIYAGIKKVWASPFTLRSFSWRQTLVDEPFWVLPSIVILESVRSEKSGVLVTADIFHDDPEKMLVATSEGVGGAVDGTPAETLLWSSQGVELINLFKSPRRLMLKPEGGSEVVPSTGQEYVLSEQELEKLVAAAGKINKAFKPALDQSGKPRPWDIEFGFAKGQLWLFQCRPFIGNEELRNIPALAALDGTGEPARGDISLKDVVK
jgi:hypothetical protein